MDEGAVDEEVGLDVDARLGRGSQMPDESQMPMSDNQMMPMSVGQPNAPVGSQMPMSTARCPCQPDAPRKPEAQWRDGRLKLKGPDKQSTIDLDIESQREVAQEGRSGFEAAMWDQADADDEDMEEGSTPVKVGRRSRGVMRKRNTSSEEKGNKMAKT